MKKIRNNIIIIVVLGLLSSCSSSHDEFLIELEGRQYCLDCYYASNSRLPSGWYTVNSEHYKPQGEFILADQKSLMSECDSLERKFQIRLYMKDGYLKKINLHRNLNTDSIFYKINWKSASISFNNGYKNRRIRIDEFSDLVFEEDESGYSIYQD